MINERRSNKIRSEPIMGPMAEYVEAIKSPDVMAAPTMKKTR